ncbi:hypothetical protein Vau01_036950 [Virgisporangium aurantiacum]|uniref:Uncharacterized protein n=1 Tax=Virgisporangium aurantiacum TaxID=175570 RepID=A0A8J3Z240_9ACTN|nr:hypothetical protein Vau01_036950 [Virgisporangium aurantiacum]
MVDRVRLRTESITRWNILRCFTGVEASTGPDHALSHESVRNGVRGLPDMLGRLPVLGALLTWSFTGRSSSPIGLGTITYPFTDSGRAVSRPRGPRFGWPG